MDSTRIAVIIEDDRDIRDLIEVVLVQSGFEVHAVGRGAAGVEAVRQYHPSVVTLDLGLPDIDGFEVARQIRLFSDSYIIMLTARAEELDTLMGLESGADDYLTKPFRPRELRARVAAMLRRPRLGSVAEDLHSVTTTTTATADALVASTTAADTREFVAAPAVALPAVALPAADDAAMAAAWASSENSPSALVSGPGQASLAGSGTAAVQKVHDHGLGSLMHNGLLVNGPARTALVDGSELELTRTEFDLLHALMESGKTVRSKADLVRRLRAEPYDTGGYISEADERTIEVHMGNLRRKLGDDSRDPRWVKTVRGVGYRLAP
ncbi:response regulator transcription factor [Paenarthrobacter sp. Z7-10]|uniref:response regulator transcription factor n=1 Tax=Paenarthrobacter sp. Z7-10 TaxID=2787635 RepID=UPI0022A99E46|nr:response regulator transcription factor [Paenarthrobacter sp. Z7-10]MCZ2402925.1 response regulator transcription factor [Paenarthrobacter sp. Z7-10]